MDLNPDVIFDLSELAEKRIKFQISFRELSAALTQVTNIVFLLTAFQVVFSIRPVLRNRICAD